MLAEPEVSLYAQPMQGSDALLILEEIMRHNIYRDGAVHVMAAECGTCIFRPDVRPVAGARVAEMVRATLEEDAASIVCHSTLYQEVDRHAICRGWYDRLGDRSVTLRLAAALGRIQEQVS